MFDRSRRLGWLALAAGLMTSVPVMAAASLPLGGTLYRPGSSQPGQTDYSTQLPGYCTAINQVAQLFESPILLGPGSQGMFNGHVTSTAYRNPAGGLTFTYLFSNTGPSSDPVIVVASLLKQDWLAPQITDAGSDGAGSSGTNDSPEWTNGDPYFIFRGSDGVLEFDWLVGTTGTVIGPGDQSALIWIETNTLNYRTSLVGLADGGAVGQAAVIAAPEPATLMLLAAGAMLLLRRR
jgi:hypothetical protein